MHFLTLKISKNKLKKHDKVSGSYSTNWRLIQTRWCFRSASVGFQTMAPLSSLQRFRQLQGKVDQTIPSEKPYNNEMLC